MPLEPFLKKNAGTGPAIRLVLVAAAVAIGDLSWGTQFVSSSKRSRDEEEKASKITASLRPKMAQQSFRRRE